MTNQLQTKKNIEFVVLPGFFNITFNCANIQTPKWINICRVLSLLFFKFSYLLLCLSFSSFVESLFFDLCPSDFQKCWVAKSVRFPYSKFIKQTQNIIFKGYPFRLPLSVLVLPCGPATFEWRAKSRQVLLGWNGVVWETRPCTGGESNLEIIKW